MPAAEPLAQQSSRVYADYWRFTINLGSNMQDPPLDPDLAPGADIIATHNHSAVVRTSFRSGSVDIDLQSWQHDPGPIDTQYDAVATAVIASDRSSIWVEGFMSSSGAVRMDLPPSEYYTVRVYSFHRFLDSDLDSTESAPYEMDAPGDEVERYLIQAWPSGNVTSPSS